MAEYTYHYDNLKDRQAKVKAAEDLGYLMLHDNFDKEWKPSEEPHGALIFTDVIPPSPVITDWRGEWQKASTTAQKLSVIAKILKLEG